MGKYMSMCLLKRHVNQSNLQLGSTETLAHNMVALILSEVYSKIKGFFFIYNNTRQSKSIWCGQSRNLARQTLGVDTEYWDVIDDMYNDGI